MTNPVFLAAADEIAPLGLGDRFLLTGSEGRHAAVVQRMAIGEPLDLVDGETGLRLRCVVKELDGDAVRVEVIDRGVELTGNPRLILVQALAKGDRSEQAIEFATELGVDEIIPWQAARSIVQWRGEKSSRGVEKWRNVVRAGAKQARRSIVPRVGELVVSGRAGGLTALIEPAIADGGIVLVLHEEADLALTNCERWLPRNSDATCPEIWLIVGPEGGITIEERAELKAAGVQEVRLGPTVLRSSSAGPAALTVLLVQLGRW